MTEDEIKNIDMVKKLLGGGNINIEQFVNGNGIYVEKIENHYQSGSSPKDEAATEEEKPEDNPSPKPASSSGRRKEALFVNQRENGKDEELTRDKAYEFKAFLTQHHWASRKLDSKRESPINRAFLAFYKRWQREELISRGVANTRAVFRFLNDDCGIRNEVTIETFSNVMRKWLADGIPEDEEMDRLIADFYRE